MPSVGRWPLHWASGCRTFPRELRSACRWRRRAGLSAAPLRRGPPPALWSRLGGLLALALAGWVSAALPWLMSLAAGCMVCVTAQEMIPEAVEADEPAGVISVVAGFALMMALDVAL